MIRSIVLFVAFLIASTIPSFIAPRIAHADTDNPPTASDKPAKPPKTYWTFFGPVTEEDLPAAMQAEQSSRPFVRKHPIPEREAPPVPRAPLSAQDRELEALMERATSRPESKASLPAQPTVTATAARPQPAAAAAVPVTAAAAADPKPIVYGPWTLRELDRIVENRRDGSSNGYYLAHLRGALSNVRKYSRRLRHRSESRQELATVRGDGLIRTTEGIEGALQISLSDLSLSALDIKGKNAKEGALFLKRAQDLSALLSSFQAARNRAAGLCSPVDNTAGSLGNLALWSSPDNREAQEIERLKQAEKDLQLEPKGQDSLEGLLSRSGDDRQNRAVDHLQRSIAATYILLNTYVSERKADFAVHERALAKHNGVEQPARCESASDQAVARSDGQTPAAKNSGPEASPGAREDARAAIAL